MYKSFPSRVVTKTKPERAWENNKKADVVVKHWGESVQGYWFFLNNHVGGKRPRTDLMLLAFVM